MAAGTVDAILQELRHAATLYHRLVLLVAPPGGGKTRALTELARRTGARLVSVNLELSRLLIELPDRQRPHRLPQLLVQLIAEGGGDTVLLDHLELLFHPSLEQDPLRLLQQLSRSRTLAAAWPGRHEAGYLVYAEPGHPEYHRYDAQETSVVELPPTL